MNLKERIAQVIAYSELSSSEFADEVEVQRSSISHITSGRNKPSLDFLIKIKSRFPELKWEWLIEGEGKMLGDGTEEEIHVKIKPASLPDLFSLINDESFGITESEDAIISQPVRESKISEQVSIQNDLSNSQRLENSDQNTKPELNDNHLVKIKRIVFFYENGKFETFEP
jgi:DNA-binding XRE family transcriptional regulator